MRADLPLAQQAVQAVHAGIFAARELMPPDLVHPNLVLLTVPDKSALLRLMGKCNEAGVANRVFVEADIGDEPTALATEAVNGKARRLFKDLPLFRGGT